MQPNYEFIGVNAQRLLYSLEQLRNSAEFRAIESTLASRFENIVIVMGDGVVPYTSWPLNYPRAEATISVGDTQYVYINTASTAVKLVDGTWQSLSVEQLLVHALSHGASSVPTWDNPFGTNPNAASELEAINRTNIVTQEAGLARRVG